MACGRLSPAPRSKQNCGCDGRQSGANPTAAKACLKLQTGFACLTVECPVRTVIALQRFPKVIRPVGVLGLGRLLRIKSGLSEIAVEKTGSQFIANNGLYSRPAGINFPPGMVCSPIDRSCAHFRLEDRRHG